jgi:phage FluMu protein Com
VLILEEVRCPNILPHGEKCNRRLGDINGQARIKCSKCKALVEIDIPNKKIYVKQERQK